MTALTDNVLTENCPGKGFIPLSSLPQKELTEIIVLSRLGDQSAFAELVRRIRVPVKSLALRIIHNPDDAADIAQLTFLKVWGNLYLYDTGKPFMTWLYRITVNTAIDFKRTSKRHKHGALEDIEESTVVIPKEDSKLLERIRLRQQVSQATSRLKTKQKRALYLRDVIGSSVEEMTADLHIPEPTARWHLHQARTIVRKELRRRCPDLLCSFGIK